MGPSDVLAPRASVAAVAGFSAGLGEAKRLRNSRHHHETRVPRAAQSSFNSRHGSICRPFAIRAMLSIDTLRSDRSTELTASRRRDSYRSCGDGRAAGARRRRSFGGGKDAHQLRVIRLVHAVHI